jgi:sodium pump decarboxylase gamma subunit
MDRVMDAVVYSFIAFSIVFIVLGGLTLVIYAMRMVTGSNEKPKAPNALEGGSVTPAAQATTAPAPSAQNVKGRHVAAITAAILAATRGHGKILSILPEPVAISSESTRMWRAAGIVEAVGRRLAPTWKR